MDKNAKKQKLTIGSWNVRTLLDLNNDRARRRTALIEKEPGFCNVDIAALSEKRFADAGELHEKGYTFYWTTCAMDKKGTSGVGFAVAKRLIENIIETPKTILDRLMKMRICL